MYDKGRLIHYCFDWDLMEINETCPEIECCTCDFSSYGLTKDQVKQIILEAKPARDALCDPANRATEGPVSAWEPPIDD